jgi:hypothetical protein
VLDALDVLDVLDIIDVRDMLDLLGRLDVEDLRSEGDDNDCRQELSERMQDFGIPVSPVRFRFAIDYFILPPVFFLLSSFLSRCLSPFIPLCRFRQSRLAASKPEVPALFNHQHILLIALMQTKPKSQ